MIAVAVADNRVLDLRRIQSEFLQPVDDLGLDRVVENRIDQDDAVRRVDGPRRIFGLSDEVQVVEHLDRLRVPLFPRRRLPRLWGSSRWYGSPTAIGRPWRRTHRVEETRMLAPSRHLRRGAVTFDRVRRLLGERGGDTQRRRQYHRHGNAVTHAHPPRGGPERPALQPLLLCAFPSSSTAASSTGADRAQPSRPSDTPPRFAAYS